VPVGPKLAQELAPLPRFDGGIHCRTGSFSILHDPGRARVLLSAINIVFQRLRRARA